MTPDGAGAWLLHCPVNDHILARGDHQYQVT
jgi:hypothetical protein